MVVIQEVHLDHSDCNFYKCSHYLASYELSATQADCVSLRPVDCEIL